MARQTTSDTASDGGTFARAAMTLTSGTRVAVEVESREHAQALAQKALDSAAFEVARLSDALPSAKQDPSDSYCGIVGRSEAMMELRRLLERIGSSNATVLVTGENGTGKELVARAVHQQSGRAGQRFVATNCSAFNDNLLESELFGHRRGAFTGAVVDKPGLFEVADNGTFFLDEVGDMSPGMQVKLLRVLQEGVFMPVGATAPKKVDVRIIAATNRDVTAMVRSGQFREDLYYRLHVVAVRVPSLRERRDDIPVLVEHFLARLAERDGRPKAIDQDALDKLVAHEWPGNVRELENEIERLWVLSGDESVITAGHMTPAILARSRPTRTHDKLPSEPPEARPAESSLEPGPQESTLPKAVEALERRMIGEGLRRANGNKTRAAEELGISRRNLIRKVQAYELDNSWASTDKEGGSL